MNTKLKLINSIATVIMLLLSANTYGYDNYCKNHIVNRAITGFSINTKELQNICTNYDACRAKQNTAQTNCEKQFKHSVAKQCNQKYGRNADVCHFSAETYSKLLQRHAKKR